MNGVRNRDADDFKAKQLKYTCTSRHPEAESVRLFGSGVFDDVRLTHGHIAEIFSVHGRIWDVSIHKGFFFVQYDNEKSAFEALQVLHGSSTFGGILVLKFAKREDFNPPVHHSLEKSDVPCKYFQVDNCYRGKDCHFKHIKDPSFIYEDQFGRKLWEDPPKSDSNRRGFDERPPHLRTPPRGSPGRSPPRRASPTAPSHRSRDTQKDPHDQQDHRDPHHDTQRDPRDQRDHHPDPHRDPRDHRDPHRDTQKDPHNQQDPQPDPQRDPRDRHFRDRDRRLRTPERRRSPPPKRVAELLPDVPPSRRSRVEDPLLPIALPSRSGHPTVPVVVQAPIAVASVAAASAAASAAAGTPEVDLRPPFDCVIITFSERFRRYCMIIEDKLIARRMLTNIQIVGGEHLFKKAVEEAARYTIPYAICISENNVDHHSITLNILHGIPQEHRNMPFEDALALLERSFNGFVQRMKKKIAAVNDWTPPTKNMIGILSNIMKGTPVKFKQMVDAIDYFQILKEKARAIDSINDPSIEEAAISPKAGSSFESRIDDFGLPPPKAKLDISGISKDDFTSKRTSVGIDFDNPAVKRAIAQLMAAKTK